MLTTRYRSSGELSIDIWDLDLPQTPQCVLQKTLPANVNFRSDASQTIAFSNEAANFLLGNMAMDKQGYSSPTLLNEPRAGQAFQPLSTDFDRRAEIVVVASRNVHQQTQEKKRANNDIKAKSQIKADLDTDSSGDESETDSKDGYSSTSTDENSAYEIFSEGSTDSDSSESEDKTSEDDLADDYESAEYPEEDQDEADSDYKSEDSKQKLTTKQPDRAMLKLNYGPSSEKKLEFEGDVLKRKEKARPPYPGVPGRFKHPHDRIVANVTVYNIGSGQAVRLFHHEHDVSAMLYHSPPVLHPHKNLLVWPLGGGEVLFAEYEQKTYFTRATMPTTRDSELRPKQLPLCH